MSQDDEPQEENITSKPTVLRRLKRRASIELPILWAFFKIWPLRAIFIGMHLTLVLAGFYAVVWWTAGGGCYSNVDKVPVRLVGVVLGCVKKAGRYDNEFFKTRVDAAAKLFHAGKVQYLLVSGDNSHNGYDEPTDLKAALMAEGVPADHIYCDYAGFRTLDSIIRTKKVFGQDDCTIISQRFHNERALYIGRRSGMPDAVAFDARNPSSESTAKMYFRELFARFKAVLDVEFLQTQPRFLGKRITIGPNDPPVDAQPVPGAAKKE